jgi:hypothetical protein
LTPKIAIDIVEMFRNGKEPLKVIFKNINNLKGP